MMRINLRRLKPAGLFSGLLCAAVLSAVLPALLSAAAASIIVPEPPPELPDTLTDYRTRQQQAEATVLENEEQPPEVPEPVEPQEAPLAVPGDDSAGVIRFSGVYVPEQSIGVPLNGAAVLRFYDLQGVPWEIRDVRVETQGFSAAITASPSELLIRQHQGAAAARLAVRLSSHARTLVFSLRPARLEQSGIPVNTTLYSVEIDGMLNAQGHVYPKIEKMPEPNPNATTAHFENVDQSVIEQVLVEAVRALKAGRP